MLQSQSHSDYVVVKINDVRYTALDFLRRLSYKKLTQLGAFALHPIERKKKLLTNLGEGSLKNDELI